MMKKIKSSFILKKVFNNTNNKRKYNTIVYNKNLQKKLGLDLIDFRRFSGKYKIEKDGKTKIYNSYDNKLLFEGYYLNGKRNGEGEEYDDDGNLLFIGEYDGNLLFIGEYLEDKRWKGKEKIYNEDGKLIFEYQIINGIINGELKEYDKYNGELLFEGNYSNGKRNGKGKEYKSFPKEKSDYNNYYYYHPSSKYELITIFDGEYLNGERKQGKEYDYEGNLIYEGEYLNEGELKNGIKNGKGIEYDSYHDIKYEGEFLNGKKKWKRKRI